MIDQNGNESSASMVVTRLYSRGIFSVGSQSQTPAELDDFK